MPTAAQVDAAAEALRAHPASGGVTDFRTVARVALEAGEAAAAADGNALQWAVQSLRSPEPVLVRRVFQMAVQLLALAQARVGIRMIVLDLQANNDVVVSTVWGAQGENRAPYARVSRDGAVNILNDVEVRGVPE
jgi:hypothetical protein